MKFKKKVNNIRRNVMKTLTRNIGKNSSLEHHRMIEKDLQIRRVLITRPNHRLGNLLLLTSLVQEVSNTFPDCKIDLFVKGGISPLIFKNYTNIDRIIQLPKKPFQHLLSYIKGWSKLTNKKYDLTINASLGSSSGRISTLLAQSKYKVFGDHNESYAEKYSDYNHSAKNSVYNFRIFLNDSDLQTNSTVPNLDIKLSSEEIKEGKKILFDIVKNSRKTICLFTNATGEKCYSDKWWAKFYSELEKLYPEVNIIELLPVENISKLNFTIPAFYSKDIREMGSLIANTDLFIAADSGVMHLASAVGTSTIGLFSVSSEEVYRPFNNHSFSINTNNLDLDGMTELIHKKCTNLLFM
ncbi:glycosyltransferase family 9 protein [Chryseobacterium arthrosphaerae]|uniref:glycosyltransferase family 9 protein n=1 Tax=Chryseobacterium arthrosphaerae TaxID=651561 RepID=UPI0023E1703B|nr:glycosyltransferase family 9 protein [Chryseobacterium arthrosphaerae]WES99508.1 glycosyltransferase family 9 protein [Chryseobacterium arthrosphaerae]